MIPIYTSITLCDRQVTCAIATRLLTSSEMANMCAKCSGTTLFLHGDICERRMGISGTTRHNIVRDILSGFARAGGSRVTTKSKADKDGANPTLKGDLLIAGAVTFVATAGGSNFQPAAGLDRRRKYDDAFVQPLLPAVFS
jgi:hypothetical protein